MEKIKEFLNKYINKENWNKVKSWCIANKRYFLGAALLIALILVLKCCAGPKEEKVVEEATEEGTETFELDLEFETDAHKEVNDLVSNYFSSYASGDLESLEKIAYPMSDNEKSYIGVFSQYIESYQNVKCYTKKGMDDGSYLVSVYFDMKFYGIDTCAPGLDFFYVQKDAAGNMYINNLYSPYNLSRTENDLDPNVYAVILRFEQQEDSTALRQEVETKYQEAVSSDVDLATMISATIPGAMNTWMESVNAVNGETSEGTEGVETEDTQAEATEGEETADENPEAVDETDATDENAESEETPGAEENPEVIDTPPTVQVTASSVNVRNKPSTDGDAIGKAKSGSTYTKLGESGEWTKIDYNGSEGYIKSEFVTVID